MLTFVTVCPENSQVGEYDNDRDINPLRMDRKRPIVWLDGELDTPKLASVELKYMKIKVLIALVRVINLYFVIDSS